MLGFSEAVEGEDQEGETCDDRDGKEASWERHRGEAVAAGVGVTRVPSFVGVKIGGDTEVKGSNAFRMS